MGQREIKFRVWEVLNKVMLGNGVACEYLHHCVTGIRNIPASDAYRESYIIMQYTGLKDKKGKEIYEGDIVKYTFKWETYIPDSEESYDNVSIKNREVLFADGAFRMKDESGTLSQARDNNIEVIGNIYENKSLLNDI